MLVGTLSAVHHNQVMCGGSWTLATQRGGRIMGSTPSRCSPWSSRMFACSLPRVPPKLPPSLLLQCIKTT